MRDEHRIHRQHSQPGAWATVLGLVVAVLLFVPVVLLPLTTAVPVWAWLPLVFLSGMALFWFILRRRQRLVRPTSVGIVAMAAVAAVVISQTLAVTPPITGADGHPVPNSVASMEKVQLNGSEQWITVRGHDRTNPVLLNLGMGGPGGGGFFNSMELRALEKDYTVVNWDEPGTGKSYGAVAFDELTPQRFIADAVALTRLLQQRFGQEKIYLYGVSWSSILGIWLVQEHPELFYAFVSSGQMVNTTENDRMRYDMAVQHLQEQGQTQRVEKLRDNGPPPYRGDRVVRRYVEYLDVLNEMMGTPRYSTIVPLIPFFVPEYGYVDKINHTRGLIHSFNAVYPQLEELDFIAQAPELKVPVFFFVGRDDVNAMASLVEEYYEVLTAPHKELISLKGGHGLGAAENQSVFYDVMVHDVLPLSHGT